MKQYLKSLLFASLSFLYIFSCHDVMAISNTLLPQKSNVFLNGTTCRIACATFLQLAVSSGIVFVHLLRKAYVAAARSNDVAELAKVINKALGAKTDEPSHLIKMSTLFLAVCIVSSWMTYVSYQAIKSV